MTDKVEIKPDSTNETLEQSAEKLQKEGELGRKKIIQYTRYGDMEA